MDLARGIGVVGIGLALGVAGVVWARLPLGSPAGALLGAVFFVGVAFTIGALMPLAWAAYGPHTPR